jgi:hypothetical protein
VSDRLQKISKLLSSQKSRAGYIKAKLSVLVPAQIRGLRLKSVNPAMPFQRDLARETELHQSRISMFETPGMSNMTLETLSKIAAGLRVGVIVKFVPFHEMLRWENSFSLDTFDVHPRLEEDYEFLNPAAVNKLAEVVDIGLLTQVGQGEVPDSAAGGLNTSNLNSENPFSKVKKPSQVGAQANEQERGDGTGWN